MNEMIEITIISADSISRTVRIASNATLEELLSMPQVLDFFGMEDSQDLLDALVSMGDTNTESDVIKNMLKTATLIDGVALEFDLEASELDSDDEDEQATTTNNAPVAGIVTVATSNGLQTTTIPIVVGITSLREAIYNDTIRARSGMTDAQLSNCNVVYNGNTISGGALLDATKLADGDEIVLTARVASTKGC